MKIKLLYFIITTITSFNLYSQNNRPQELKEPFEYTIENVVFKNNLDRTRINDKMNFVFHFHVWCVSNESALPSIKACVN